MVWFGPCEVNHGSIHSFPPPLWTVVENPGSIPVCAWSWAVYASYHARCDREMISWRLELPPPLGRVSPQHTLNYRAEPNHGWRVKRFQTCKKTRPERRKQEPPSGRGDMCSTNHSKGVECPHLPARLKLDRPEDVFDIRSS